MVAVGVGWGRTRTGTKAGDRASPWQAWSQRLAGVQPSGINKCMPNSLWQEGSLVISPHPHSPPSRNSGSEE